MPAAALVLDTFLDIVDYVSIGSNDLTQMTLAVDRNSDLVAPLFDERDPAVKALLHLAIDACRRNGKYAGICGQGPSDHPDLAAWLLDQGKPDTKLTAMAKLYACHVAVEVVDEALQLHGGYGYFNDYDVERFYRADAARTTPGSGLGLSIVKNVARAHGGSVAVASKVGIGSTFALSLPTVPAGAEGGRE